MGADFFRVIKDIQDFYKKKGKKFSNGIQTNGTLITNELLELIRETQDFQIGLSLDGPEEIHNKTRIYENGRGSFDDVMRGLNLISREKKNRRAGVICVVSKQNINSHKELYNFFKNGKNPPNFSRTFDSQ